jgi:CRISPR/Cas system endoribonuclease Cas6 (RAMP superfamily)
MDLSPEVLTYLQTVKNYLKKNDEARRYFLHGVDEEKFFDHLTEIAQKNFNQLGEPMLNKEQFDLLRKTMKAISIVDKSVTELEEETPDPEKNIFVDYRGFGKICLN